VSLPLRTRLTLWYVTLFALVVGVWSLVIVLLVRADLYFGIDHVLASRAAEVAAAYRSERDADFHDVTASTLAGTPPVELAAQLLSPTGAIVDSSGDSIGRRNLVGGSLIRRARASDAAITRTVRVGDESFRVIVARLPRSDRLVLVGMSTETADLEIRRLSIAMLLIGPLVLVFAGTGGWLLVHRALQPVAEMASTAASIGVDRLSERVPTPQSGDELSDLAATLNGMLSRLEAGVQQKRRLIADASHELQTPLAVMRTELDVTLASCELGPDAVRVLESTREEADRMGRIVRNLLTLARFDEGSLRLLCSPVDLRAIAAQATESLASLAAERGVRVGVSGDAAPLVADADCLRTVVVNLLENAIKYSGKDSSVSLGTSGDADYARLNVSDTGPGIPPDALEYIFDRFYRGDGSRTRSGGGGSGLGLAITKEIVEAHGGTVEVTSAEGQGTTFTVTLPAGGPRPGASARGASSDEAS